MSIDLAYAAGFFDGEGSIGIYRTNQTQIQISNTCRAALEEFVKLFGGHVGKVPAKHMEAKNPKWRPAYYWRLYGRNASKALQEMLPYLKEKKPQAELFLTFVEMSPEDKKNSDIPQQLKKLKKVT